MNLEDFELKYELGRGAFGRVYYAELPSNGRKYAVKSIRKDKILEHNMIEITQLERNILFAANHPFLCGMEYCYQTDLRIYFVMPFIEGGELYRIFKKRGKFVEK